MKHGLSISLRLTLWFSTIFLCGFVGFGAFLWLDLATSLTQGRDKTLTTRARRMAELLEVTAGLDANRREARVRDFADATPEGRLVQVFTPAGERILPPVVNSASQFPWPAVPAGAGEFRESLTFQNRQYRVFSRPAKFGDRSVRIFVAGQLEDNRLQLQRFTDSLIHAIPVVLVVAGLAGYFVSRRALDPVARLIDSGRSITIGNLSRRLPVSRNGDELARLAETWNSMLARLEGAVNRITRFTADASHELRSPLTFIRMAAESMQKQPGLDGEVAEGLREIVVEAENASRLLDDMLMLARSDAGHIEVAFEPVGLCDVVRNVTGKIRVMAEEKRQSLEECWEAEAAEVSGDANLLRRLTWILVDNAIKYTPRGGRIGVAVRRSASHPVLEVTDSGRGIPAESLPHIFERFYRVDPARSEEEGTGLGLAIAKWIVDTHGAEVRVSSREHAGTTFQVLFPPLRNE